MPLFWRSALVSLRAWWRIAKQLFHETMGAFFAVFAVYGLVAAWRSWKAHSVVWVIPLAVAYTLMMAVFSVAAFRRARQIGVESRR